MNAWHGNVDTKTIDSKSGEDTQRYLNILDHKCYKVSELKLPKIFHQSRFKIFYVEIFPSVPTIYLDRKSHEF